jgi:integrase
VLVRTGSTSRLWPSSSLNTCQGVIVTITDRMAAWRRERRVLQRVSRCAGWLTHLHTSEYPPAAAADIQAVLSAICSRRPRKDVPVDVLRDRVLFETAYVCGARASEVCGMYVEDLDLRPDDEHARVHGKGGTVRTVLLDDRGYVALLRLYLARAEYTSGPLFRASINGRDGSLSYDAAHNRWKKYCAAVGAGIGIHQLRHAHATEFQRRLHRGRAPPPRPRLYRDHPGLHPARRQGRRHRDPRRPPTP